MSEGPRWITAAEVEGGVIPPGGATDDVLAKQSNTDYDLKWAAGGGGGGIGGSIADQQVAFGNGTDIAGSDDFIFDGSSISIVELPAISSDGNTTVTVGDPSTVNIAIDERAGSSGGIIFNVDGGAVSAGLSLGNFFFTVPLQLPVSADPPSPAVEGMIYADTDHHLYYYNGTDWKQLDN